MHEHLSCYLSPWSNTTLNEIYWNGYQFRIVCHWASTVNRLLSGILTYCLFGKFVFRNKKNRSQVIAKTNALYSLSFSILFSGYNMEKNWEPWQSFKQWNKGNNVWTKTLNDTWVRSFVHEWFQEWIILTLSLQHVMWSLSYRQT